MKILQISSGRFFGNYERHFVELCRGLQNRGHDIYAVVRPSSEWREKLDFLPAQNIFPVSIRNSFGIFSAQKIASIIREKGIEIAHAHLTKDYFPISLSCRLAKNTRFVLTRHSSAPLKSFHRFSLTNLARAIAVSKSGKRNLQTLFTPEKVAFIPNGVKSKESAERKKAGESFRFEHNIPFDAPFIGTIGNLKEANGQRDFVLAAKIVAEKFPDAHFAVVGEDKSMNQSFRRELKRMVRIFGLEKRFLWLNFVADLSDFLDALDVYVSLKSAGSSYLTILQALANQTPLVSLETEFLQADKTGLIVPNKEPVALAESVGRILTDENLRISLNQNAEAIVEEKFGLTKMLDETEKFYQTIK
jgi:glycosyltransferase involved in cell wall biosynthesis